MDSIDINIIGLQATLQMLQQYYQSGVLQADVGSAFRMHGSCMAHIVISEGEIVSCYVEDTIKQRQPTQIAILLNMDAEEGPFTWRFYAQEQSKGESPVTLSQKNYQSPASRLPVPSNSRESSFKAQRLTSSAIPRRIATLDLSWLTTWSPQQKRILRMVYAMVDGQRSVEMIERSVLSSKVTVQEALVVLIAMQVITVYNP